jgi:hypothetical protein
MSRTSSAVLTPPADKKHATATDTTAHAAAALRYREAVVASVRRLSPAPHTWGPGAVAVPRPAVVQIRAARDVLRMTPTAVAARLRADRAARGLPPRPAFVDAAQAQAELVAEVCAEAVPRLAPDPVLHRWARLRALFSVWRKQVGCYSVATPLWWPPTTAVWMSVARQDLASVRSPRRRAAYVAWRFGTELSGQSWAATVDNAREVCAAVALFVAWRDDLAQQEARRRIREEPDAFDYTADDEADCDD